MLSALSRVILFSCALSLSTLSLAMSSKTESPVQQTFVAGKDYEVLAKPVITRNKNKVEVVELFWYGCPHCYTFESLLTTWKQKQPNDVDIIPMPAMWNKTMELHAKAFYTAQALDKLDSIHKPFFEALVIKRERINKEADIQKFFSDRGVDKEAFEDTFNSFGVNSQVTLASSRAKSYGMRGTPEVIINGKYRISIGQVKTQEKMLEVANFLIEKERQALQDKTKASEASTKANVAG